jgi:hypothetical protein
MLTRGFLIVMPEADGHFNAPKEKELLSVREMLTAYRWWTMRNGIMLDPDVPGLRAGRWRDITKPIRQVIDLVAPDRLPMVDRALEHVYRQRMSEKSEDPDAYLVQAVMNLQAKRPGADLPTRLIKQEFVELTSLDSVKDKYIGGHMVALGFQSVYINEGERRQRGYRLDRKLMEQLRKKYGLPEMGTHVTNRERMTGSDQALFHVGGNGKNR